MSGFLGFCGWHVFAPWPNQKWVVHPITLPRTLEDNGLVPLSLTTQALAKSRDAIAVTKHSLVTEVGEAKIPVFGGSPLVVCGMRHIIDPADYVRQSLKEMPASIAGEHVNFYLSDQTQPLMQQLRGIRRMLGLPIYEIRIAIEGTTNGYVLDGVAFTGSGERRIRRAITATSALEIEYELALTITEFVAEPSATWIRAADEGSLRSFDIALNQNFNDQEAGEMAPAMWKLKLMSWGQQNLLMGERRLGYSYNRAFALSHLRRALEANPDDAELQLLVRSMELEWGREIPGLSEFIDEANWPDITLFLRDLMLVQMQPDEAFDCSAEYSCLITMALQSLNKHSEHQDTLAGLTFALLFDAASDTSDYEQLYSRLEEFRIIPGITKDWLYILTAMLLIFEVENSNAVATFSPFPDLKIGKLTQLWFGATLLSESDVPVHSQACYHERAQQIIWIEIQEARQRGEPWLLESGLDFLTFEELRSFLSRVDIRKPQVRTLQQHFYFLLPDERLHSVIDLIAPFLEEERDFSYDQTALVADGMRNFLLRGRPELAIELYERYPNLRVPMADDHFRVAKEIIQNQHTD